MQRTLVVKFGGAALEGISDFVKAAKIVSKRCDLFSRIVVVVSAMKGMTDHLLQMAKSVSPTPPKREQDMLLSVGERISMALLAMVFAENGCEAISFTGSQAGIITSSEHSEAKIIDVRPKRLLSQLEEKKIVIVAGFQGMSEKGEITTLGRGGSDTTAVALAIALGAELVEFYKDVDGIFETDPKVDPKAKKLSVTSYKTALEIVAKGEKKLLHPRALFLAEKNMIPLHIYSFKEEGEGSSIKVEEKDRCLSKSYEEGYAEHFSYSV